MSKTEFDELVIGAGALRFVRRDYVRLDISLNGTMLATDWCPSSKRDRAFLQLLGAAIDMHRALEKIVTVGERRDQHGQFGHSIALGEMLGTAQAQLKFMAKGFRP